MNLADGAIAMRRWRDDRGQAVALVVVVVAFAVVLTAATAHLGRDLVDAGRARSAADAAALAGVEGGREASQRLAGEHGAELVAWSRSGDGEGVTVSVTVRVGRARATASASNAPAPNPRPPPGEGG